MRHICTLFFHIMRQGTAGRKNMGRTKYIEIIRKAVIVEAVLIIVLTAGVVRQKSSIRAESSSVQSDSIKWVDFNVGYEALCDAYHWDVETHDTKHPVDWIELLAYTAARTGGEFDKKALAVLNKTAEKLASGEEELAELTADLKYYDYYMEAYGAVLGGMVGEFEEECEDADGGRSYRKNYGLKAFFHWQRALTIRIMMISERGEVLAISGNIWDMT